MWKYCEICYVSITIYIKEKKKVQTEDEKKKTLGTIATVLLGTVATFQKKKKRKKSDSPKLHCR